jgi:hypothetical protein
VVRCPYLLNLGNADFLCKCCSHHAARSRALQAAKIPNTVKGDSVDVAIWSTVEQGLAITAGSLATTRPLLRRSLARIRQNYASAARMADGPGEEGVNLREIRCNPNLASSTDRLSCRVNVGKSDKSSHDSDGDVIMFGECGIGTSISNRKFSTSQQCVEHGRYAESQEELTSDHNSGDL